VAVTDRLDRQRDVRPAPEGYEGTHDPHVWFDVTLWMKAVEHVRDTLAELDPGSAELYRTNAKNYLAELAKLHEYVKTEAKKVPPQHRVLVTAHDAFYYFGHAYGFKIASVQGISTLAEARPQDIQKLADEIVRERYPAIFVESSVPKQTIEKVQAAARAQGYDVKIGGELFSDAMGDKGTPEGTYVGMVRHNIDTIVKGLAR
jgi:manganese/zinc/iron transport system substrate-binding protein